MKTKILPLLCLLGFAFPGIVYAQPESPQQTPSSSPSSDDPAEVAAHQRLPAKIERVKEIFRKWTASGRDVSIIHNMMEQEFKPLLDAEKYIEADAKLDEVIEKLSKE